MKRVVALLLLVACSSNKPAPAPQPLNQLVVFEGACDASGAVAIDAHHFAVADDEDNTLRIYHADRGGKPIAQTDVSAALGAEKKAGEADLEAATELHDRALWLASHGRTKKGKRKPDRLLIFATTRPAGGAAMTVIGTVYRTLLDDLIADPRLSRFTGEANIEGLTVGPEGFVWIGFRTPLDQGRAILVQLLNPSELQEGARAKLGQVLTLDLRGRGIRSLSWWRGRYLILAGNDPVLAPSELFTWTSSAVERIEVDLLDLNPEAFFTPETRDQIMLLSDDGERTVEGIACKRLKDPSKKSFRGLWLPAPYSTK